MGKRLSVGFDEFIVSLITFSLAILVVVFGEWVFFGITHDWTFWAGAVIGLSLGRATWTGYHAKR